MPPPRPLPQPPSARPAERHTAGEIFGRIYTRKKSACACQAAHSSHAVHDKHLSTAHICPRQNLPAAAHLPTAANTPAAAQPPDRPPSGQTSADAKRFYPSAGRTGLENLRGGWLCTHPLFQNAMCKSHKLHCFSKHLLEKALTARRRRVIVTGACVRARRHLSCLRAFLRLVFPSIHHAAFRPTSDRPSSAFRRRSIRASSPPAPTPASPPHRKCGRGRFHVLHTLHTFIFSIFLILSISIRRPCR